MPWPEVVAIATEISRNFSSVTCLGNNYSYAQKTSKTLKHYICVQLSCYLKKVTQLMEPRDQANPLRLRIPKDDPGSKQ